VREFLRIVVRVVIDPVKLQQEIRNEDKQNLQLWIDESESRLDAVKRGELGLTEYSQIKAQI